MFTEIINRTMSKPDYRFKNEDGAIKHTAYAEMYKAIEEIEDVKELLERFGLLIDFKVTAGIWTEQYFNFHSIEKFPKIGSIPETATNEYLNEIIRNSNHCQTAKEKVAEDLMSNLQKYSNIIRKKLKKKIDSDKYEYDIVKYRLDFIQDFMLEHPFLYCYDEDYPEEAQRRSHYHHMKGLLLQEMVEDLLQKNEEQEQIKIGDNFYSVYDWLEIEIDIVSEYFKTVFGEWITQAHEQFLEEAPKKIMEKRSCEIYI